MRKMRSNPTKRPGVHRATLLWTLHKTHVPVLLEFADSNPLTKDSSRSRGPARDRAWARARCGCASGDITGACRTALRSGVDGGGNAAGFCDDALRHAYRARERQAIVRARLHAGKHLMGEASNRKLFCGNMMTNFRFSCSLYVSSGLWVPYRPRLLIRHGKAHTFRHCIQGYLCFFTLEVACFAQG